MIRSRPFDTRRQAACKSDREKNLMNFVVIVKATQDSDAGVMRVRDRLAGEC